jgi:hypothetical protein
VREAEPAQHRPDRRQRAGLKATPDQLVPDLGQRDARPCRRQLAQQILLAGKQRLAVAADLRRLRAAGRAHAPHQLDRRRRADLEPSRRPAGRTALLDRADQPLAQILGQRCRHHSLAAQPATLESQPLNPCNLEVL